MQTVKDVQVVTGENTHRIQDQIAKLVKKGYVPTGGIAMAFDPTTVYGSVTAHVVFAQTMTLFAKTKPTLDVISGRGGDETIIQAVNEHFNEGWLPFGTIFFADGVFHQPIVKYVEVEQDE